MTTPQMPERRGIWALSQEERHRLALALLARPHRIGDGAAALRRRYPEAPEEMIASATHHLFVDGPGAVMDFLADAELAIRDPEHDFDYGATYHLLYHVYNWLQCRVLLPEAKADMLTLLAQIEQAVREDDKELLHASVEELREVIEASRNPPDFELS